MDKQPQSKNKSGAGCANLALMAISGLFSSVYLTLNYEPATNYKVWIFLIVSWGFAIYNLGKANRSSTNSTKPKPTWMRNLKFQLPNNKLLGQALVAAGAISFFLIDAQWFFVLGVLSIVVGSLIISKSRAADSHASSVPALSKNLGPAIVFIVIGVLFAVSPALYAVLSAPAGSDPWGEGQGVLIEESILFFTGPIGLGLAVYGLVKLLKVKRSREVSK